MRDGIPILRLGLEGMKRSILMAFNELSVQTDSMVKSAVEDFCTPERLQKIIDDEVNKTLKSAIEREVESFFRYGDGNELIKQLTRKALESKLPLD